MNESQTPEPAPTESREPMRLPARMMNIFAVPGDVFDEVRRSPNAASSWLVPLLIACVVAIAAAFILFSQDTIVRDTQRMRAESMQKQVEAGKMSQEQVDEVTAATERFLTPTILTLGGAIGGVVAAVFGVFWWGLVLWLLALVFIRHRIPYLKAVEVSGLASLIGTLTVVVTLLLQINLGSVTASPSLALVVSDYDPAKPLHMMFTALNPLKVWMVLVMGVGLAKLAGISFARAGLLVIAFYCLQTSMLIMLGAGMAML